MTIPSNCKNMTQMRGKLVTPCPPSLGIIAGCSGGSTITRDPDLLLYLLSQTSILWTIIAAAASAITATFQRMVFGGGKKPERRACLYVLRLQPGSYTHHLCSYPVTHHEVKRSH